MAEENTLPTVQPAILDLDPSASRSYDTPMVPVSPPEPEAKPNGEAKPVEEAKQEELPELEVKPPKEDETPPEYKKVITREKNRRQTAETALEAVRQQNADLTALLKRYALEPGAVQSEPNRSNYDDPDKYTEDRAKWLADRILQQRENERTQKQRQEFMSKVEADYDKRLAEAEVKYPGIMDIGRGRDMSFASMVNDAMAATIKQSDLAPEILHYLDENRDETERIFKLNPARAAAEIGKIEATLSTPKARINPPAKPIEPISGRGTVIRSKDDPNLSSDEFWALVEAERAAELAELKKRAGH